MMVQFLIDGVTPGILLLVVAMFFLLHAVVRAFFKMGVPVEEKQLERERAETLASLPAPRQILPLV